MTRLLLAGATEAPPPAVEVRDPLVDDDLHLALYCCYELHYRGFDGVADGAEWDPVVLSFRQRMERAFEHALRDALPAAPVRPEDVGAALIDAIDQAGGPSLSSYMVLDGTLEQMREFAIHRSAYQLKEADPHTWAIPRLAGDAKAALVHIQADEYGFGAPDAMHSTLFAETMRGLGLDDEYGAYLPMLPGSTLATVNLVTMFGLHRRLRGAAVGHLAVFEMTSVVPMGRYSAALARLGLGESTRRFYDVHVIADADHEVVALERMVRSLARDEPAIANDVLFGARAVLDVERRFAEALLDSWREGCSSLRVPVGVAA